MHEVSLMEGALKAVFQGLERAGGKRINVVRMKVGKLSGVVPDALQFAFEALTPGTPAEGATLDIEETPAVCYCTGCKIEYAADAYNYTCTQCGGLDIEIRSGKEFELTTMEID